MGVALRFSAQALDYYSDKSGLKVYEFLGKIQDTAYTARFSRIDFTADYLNCGIDPTKIYQKLMDGKLAIFREKTRKTASGKTETSYLKIPFSYRGFLKASEVPTIYLGIKNPMRFYGFMTSAGNKLSVRGLSWIRL